MVYLVFSERKFRHFDKRPKQVQTTYFVLNRVFKFIVALENIL